MMNRAERERLQAELRASNEALLADLAEREAADPIAATTTIRRSALPPVIHKTHEMHAEVVSDDSDDGDDVDMLEALARLMSAWTGKTDERLAELDRKVTALLIGGSNSNNSGKPS